MSVWGSGKWGQWKFARAIVFKIQINESAIKLVTKSFIIK